MAELTTTKKFMTSPYEGLSLLFSSSARAAILQALLLDPVPSYYQRQLETATGQPLRAVQRELDRLTQAGLLFRRAEGNRVYYQVNQDHPYFPELRGMILKTVPAELRLRGEAALDPAVRLCLLHPDRMRALLVCHAGRRQAFSLPGLTVETLGADAFLKALGAGDQGVGVYLRDGTDLLGRRDDILWRHVEASGYLVRKEPGVP